MKMYFQSKHIAQMIRANLTRLGYLAMMHPHNKGWVVTSSHFKFGDF